jgi:hypothetical protein
MSLGVICVIAMAVSSANAGEQDRCIKTELLARITGLPKNTLQDLNRTIRPAVRHWLDYHGLFDTSNKDVTCDDDLMEASCCKGKRPGDKTRMNYVDRWIRASSTWNTC